MEAWPRPRAFGKYTRKRRTSGILITHPLWAETIFILDSGPAYKGSSGMCLTVLGPNLLFVSLVDQRYPIGTVR